MPTTESYPCRIETNTVKEVPLHAPITCNTFQFEQKNMTDAACFRGQHFSCLEGI